jgi:transcription antitermination factor NusG
MNLAWYVLHSKPLKDELLFEQLSLRKIETFYPRIRVQTINPRARQVRAYFPGYVFVHVELDVIGYSNLQWLPGTTGLVSFGGEPASVPDGVISAIRHKVERINNVGGGLFDGLKPGDNVVIQAGPFSGYEAIFDEQISGNERVRVLLKLLQKRLAPVELPAGQVGRKYMSANHG